MAVPHYVYLKMKMPSERGILTVSGDYRRSVAYASSGAKMAEALIVAEELEGLKRKVAEEPAEAPDSKKSASESTFDTSPTYL